MPDRPPMAAGPRSPPSRKGGAYRPVWGGPGRALHPHERCALVGRLSGVAALDEAQEVRVLREIRLELSETRAGPVLEPRLGDVVLNAMKPELARRAP